MANYNNPNLGLQQPSQWQQPQMQIPYGNNNMLLNNNPYDNYMGNQRVNSQDLLSRQYIKCRPVSSKDEARACQIDLDGSLWVFTDLGNGKIYTKQINNDGTAAFKTYAFVKDENPYDSSTEYVTKDEFNKVIQTLAAAIHPAQQQTQNNNNETKAAIKF